MAISVVVFDVNETLSDMAPISARFAEVGAPEHLAKTWFAGVLRDGFALTVTGARESFAALAEGGLATVFAGLRLNRSIDDAIAHVMAGFSSLPCHPDVAVGVRALHDLGMRLITLTNGSVQVTEQLLSAAGIRDEFEALLSVEDADAWKPARSAYHYAARRCSVDPDEMLLVAVHPWDIHGAAAAGLSTGWVNRSNAPYPDYFTAPTHACTTIGELASALTAR